MNLLKRHGKPYAPPHACLQESEIFDLVVIILCKTANLKPDEILGAAQHPMKNCLLAILCAVCASSCAHIDGSSGDYLPSSFRTEAIGAGAFIAFKNDPHVANRSLETPQLTHIQVLAWKRTDTANPHVDPFDYSDSCIAWAEFQYRDGTRRWGLAHLSEDNERWGEQWVSDAPYTSSLSFNHSPNNKEITQFLKDARWIEKENIIEAGVCKRSWIAVTGEPPPMFLSFSYGNANKDAAYY